MKRFRVLVFFVAIGLMACQGREVPVYAASNGAVAAGSGASQTLVAHAADANGAAAYALHCAICHGDQREGILPGFPPLLGIGRQLTSQQITDLIHTGKGRMPAFPALQHEELTELVHYLASGEMSVAAAGTDVSAGVHSAGASGIGGSLFQQNCAFCHGRDAQGGETGPDLTRSKLVIADVNGDKISEVVRNGRPEKKMPAFNFSSQEIVSLAAFIHAQEAKAVAQKGNRKGVDVSDLQTGNVEAGKKYFNGAGGCAKCHSATGDLAGVASRYEGLKLEERMLYPEGVKSKVTVTLPSGERVTGAEAYLDEFTVGIRDSHGIYRSWPVSRVKYSVDAPVNAHVDLFSKYTDADIHNLMAYIQTMR
jgi:mono/diheme cytochrome c family protein